MIVVSYSKCSRAIRESSDSFRCLIESRSGKHEGRALKDLIAMILKHHLKSVPYFPIQR